MDKLSAETRRHKNKMIPKYQADCFIELMAEISFEAENINK